MVTLKCVATVAAWLPNCWANFLAPYIIRPAQAAYRVLDSMDAQDYHKVKTAILDYSDISPDTCHQCFQRGKYPPRTCTQVMTQSLKDYWPVPGGQTGVHIAENIVLKQFIQVLLVSGWKWVQRHWPAMLSEEVGFMENYLQLLRPSSIEAPGARLSLNKEGQMQQREWGTGDHQL